MTSLTQTARGSGSPPPQHGVIEFRILGALEVWHQSRRLWIARAKPKALLTILLLHANEVVASDRLAEELWGQPPKTAKAALQCYVAQLRKLFGSGHTRGNQDHILLTRPPGYLLQIDTDQLDSQRFERLLAQGSAACTQGATAAAAQLLRQALSLWRGPALADFIYEPFAQPEIARLEELRMAALEQRLDADLTLGAHAAVIGELEALVREHPLRERFTYQLMLALYRAGRQAEALETYQRIRHTFDTELGIAPTPALQQLQQGILRHDPAIDTPTRPAAHSGPFDHHPQRR